MSLPNDSLLGKRIDEYQIDMPLGAGGMARVYRALDTKLQRYVALKVIAPELRKDNEHALRFEREAQSIARLEHPNIVQFIFIVLAKVLDCITSQCSTSRAQMLAG